jgi:hypothetical protein
MRAGPARWDDARRDRSRPHSLAVPLSAQEQIINARASDNESAQPAPLNGVRVLDISTVYAAPIAAMLLGDYGADVPDWPARRSRRSGCRTSCSAYRRARDPSASPGGGSARTTSRSTATGSAWIRTDLAAADRARRLLELAGQRPAGADAPGEYVSG